MRDSLADLGTLPTELRRLVHDQVRLAGLELRLAGRSLAAILTAAILMAALVLLSWIALMASAGLGLGELGLPPALIMLVLAVITITMSLLLRIYIHRRSADLGFPGTVRALDSPSEKAREPGLH